MISEIEYLAPATSHEETKLAALIIYSSVREIVEHQQYVFETLWNKSMSADCQKTEGGQYLDNKHRNFNE
jgi:two-component system, OmpR family, sensor histidine kinase VicK